MRMLIIFLGMQYVLYVAWDEFLNIIYTNFMTCITQESVKGYEPVPIHKILKSQSVRF
jgi:hypothetical protein